jgi:hypothetical protein
VAAVRLGLIVVACALGAAAAARAQVAVGVEADRDRFTYRFDNPSSIDTAFLVPHFFEQRYDADNVWLVVAARYTGGIPWETVGGVTPGRSTTGDDYDTFFDPDGSVTVSGTTGPVSIQSWRVSQQGDIARAGAATVTAGYRLRVDRSDFGVGHKTVVRNGTTIEAFDVTDPARTTSQMHELFGRVRLRGEIGGGWRASIDAELSPMTLGRLLIQLPAKYPGQDLIFYARAAAGSVHATLSPPAGAWPIELGVQLGRTWSYSSAASLHRRTVAIALIVRP